MTHITQPQPGALVQVLWARMSGKHQPSDEWCSAEFLGTVSYGPHLQYLVRGCTPRTPFASVRPVAPASVRFVREVPACCPA